ncbi:MAG: hypothetical protein ACREOE_09835 [Gemmatimonadales bacterium]
MTAERRDSIVINVGIAACCGVPATAVDFLASHGDVSPPVTLAILIGTGVIMGRMSLRPWWLTGAVAGLVLPAAHIMAHALGYADNVSPNTYGARLLMAPVTVLAVLLGVWAGSALRPPRAER